MILSGLLVSTALWANLTNLYVWVVLGVTLAFGLIGFYDDYLKVTKQTHAGFSGRTRLLIEFAVAAIACYVIKPLADSPLSTSLAFPFFKDLLLNLGWFFIIFGAFIVVGAGNAVNLDRWPRRPCHRAGHDRGRQLRRHLLGDRQRGIRRISAGQFRVRCRRARSAVRRHSGRRSRLPVV